MKILLSTKKFYDKINYPGGYTKKEIMNISKSYPFRKYINGKVLDGIQPKLMVIILKTLIKQ